MMYKGFLLLLLLLLALSLTLTEACCRDYSTRNEQCPCMRFNCEDHAYTCVHGNYWVFYVYIRTSFVCTPCCTTVTYCTHCDYFWHCYLNKVRPLAAISAPGYDFEPPLQWVLCSPEYEFIQQWDSFQTYLNVHHMRSEVPKEQMMHCRGLDVFDIEPNGPMPMLYYNVQQMQPNRPTVYTANISEVSKDTQIPDRKAMLQYLLHSYTCSCCSSCHNAPRHLEWINTCVPSDHRMSSCHAANHTMKRKYRKPICTGTVKDQSNNNRMKRKRMRNKVRQTYVRCLMGNEFYILKKARLDYKSGKKKKAKNHKRKRYLRTNEKCSRPISTKYVEEYANGSNCRFD